MDVSPKRHRADGALRIANEPLPPGSDARSTKRSFRWSKRQFGDQALDSLVLAVIPWVISFNRIGTSAAALVRSRSRADDLGPFQQLFKRLIRDQVVGDLVARLPMAGRRRRSWR
jgi:hypothetical protein